MLCLFCFRCIDGDFGSGIIEGLARIEREMKEQQARYKTDDDGIDEEESANFWSMIWNDLDKYLRIIKRNAKNIYMNSTGELHARSCQFVILNSRPGSHSLFVLLPALLF